VTVMDLIDSFHGIDDFFLYFLTAVVAEAIFVVLYMAVTPHHEATLIKAGNTAAALTFGGAVIGFTLPLTSAIAHNVSLPGTVVWAAVALVVQLAVFLLANLLLRDLSRRIEEGDLAAGITVAVASLASGMISAACMTD
jgi:putative membrane protein